MIKLRMTSIQIESYFLYHENIPKTLYFRQFESTIEDACHALWTSKNFNPRTSGMWKILEYCLCVLNTLTNWNKCLFMMEVFFAVMFALISANASKTKRKPKVQTRNTPRSKRMEKSWHSHNMTINVIMHSWLSATTTSMTVSICLAASLSCCAVAWHCPATLLRGKYSRF